MYYSNDFWFQIWHFSFGEDSDVLPERDLGKVAYSDE